MKPPPTTSPYIFQQAYASETETNRGRRRERAQSSTALDGLEKPPKAARSRSNSFVSLLRAPFEFRRSSIDHSADSGFIGGIKLEIQRQAATQRVLDNQAAEDESNIHPALRKGNQGNRCSAPLKSPPPPFRDSIDASDNQRRYPPITRGRNHRHTASLISPTAPAIPDLSTIDKWRVKVGLKTSPRPASVAVTNQDANTKGVNVADWKKTVPVPKEPRPAEKVSAGNASPPRPIHVAFTARQLPREKVSDSKPMLDHGNNMSVSSCASGRTYDTAPSSPSPPPPEPPRRSSKRNSVLSLNETIPPLPSDGRQDGGPPSAPVSETPIQRSFPLHGGGPQFKGAARAAAPVNHTGVYLPSPVINHLPGSSSEDSGSDDFQSTSIISTPATSRPQSEKGLPLESNSDEPNPNSKQVDGNKKSRIDTLKTTYPVNSPENTDDEGMDHIQAAAEKVLAVFNDISVQRPGLRRRSNSQSSLTTATDASIPPSYKERPLRIRPKNRSGTSEPHLPSAASYLEDARKQTPTAIPQRAARKQRLGPPTSFMIPDSDSDAATAEAKLPSVPDMVGRSLRHKSTPLLSMTDREPVAKVFVECCSCKYYHDMPSHLYEAMANPEGVLSSVDKLGYASTLSTTVKCSWCRHEMSTRCCAGLAATVYIKERLH
jgi:hypothetical protein